MPTDGRVPRPTLCIATEPPSGRSAANAGGDAPPPHHQMDRPVRPLYLFQCLQYRGTTTAPIMIGKRRTNAPVDLRGGDHSISRDVRCARTRASPSRATGHCGTDRRAAEPIHLWWPQLLLLSERLERPWILLVRLRLPPRLWLGRRARLARLGSSPAAAHARWPRPSPTLRRRTWPAPSYGWRTCPASSHGWTTGRRRTIGHVSECVRQRTGRRTSPLVAIERRHDLTKSPGYSGLFAYWRGISAPHRKLAKDWLHRVRKMPR